MTATTVKLLAAASTVALLGATAANAQMFGDEIGTDYDRDTFASGFGETGYYDALDADDDQLLDQNEYARGLYVDYDGDNDRMISQEEFDLGNQRYYGDGYEGGVFADYDSDDDGFLTQDEFGGFYEGEYSSRYTEYDADGDGFLNPDEYSTKVYETADADRDEVLTVDEEGFFEGWFDGDDIEVETEEVGDIL